MAGDDEDNKGREPLERDPALDDTVASAPQDAKKGEPAMASTRPQDRPERSPSQQRLHDRVKRQMFAPETLPPSEYAPGQLLGGRYRVQGLLGRGGMGEVYRARDLVLEQDVALKFLPASLADDPRHLARFLAEVRLARQVTHPGVCRVHDVGEVDGRQFLTMEYIDGEDLASVLRRIGRLPQERAVALAHELCAALGALHEQGIVHRDLKPANVMLDGRGRVRIADFGLAAIAEELKKEELRDGTPAYMAPEQLRGEEVTARTDVYALGLLLYELFTGAHPRLSMDTRRPDSRITPVTDVVGGIDPAIERVIERCLEEDPNLRPSSARAVSAALPGGDPIAAALAAGELPSPETVANAGPAGRVSAGLLAATIGIVGLGILIWAFLAPHVTLLGRARAPEPFDVLVHQARESLDLAGHEEAAVDDIARLAYDGEYLKWWRARTLAGEAALAPDAEGASVIGLSYRSAQRPLVPYGSEVSMKDPPVQEPGDALVEVDGSGRLRFLRVIPRERRETQAEAFDFSPLLSAAGLDPAALRPVEPTVVPRTWADEQRAWAGTWPGAPDVPLVVEAAAAGGRAVYFELLEPWSRRWPEGHEAPAPTNGAAMLVQAILIVLVLVGGAILARRSIKHREADMRGAWAVTGWAVLTHAASRVLAAHVTGSMADLGNVLTIVRDTAALGVLAWMCYVVTEPYARRYWPKALVSWNRLLRGRQSDPLVARHVLIGLAAGVLLLLEGRLGTYLAAPEGSLATGIPSLDALQGTTEALAGLPYAGFFGLFVVLQTYVILIVLRAILRRDVATAAVFIGLRVLAQLGADGNVAIAAAQGAFEGAILFWLAVRAGLLTTVVAQSTVLLLLTYPITLQLDRWYAPIGLVPVGAVAVLLVWASRRATFRPGTTGG